MGREVVIVGSGIVGISLAHALAAKGLSVTVLDRDRGTPRGSTAFAPGFIGLYNDVALLTELARDTASLYDTIGDGFRRTGGLELATSDAGAAEVERRVETARSAGLRADLLPASGLPDTVTSYVDAGQVRVAGHFLDDASADVGVIGPALRAEALARGAKFLSGQEVVGCERQGSGIAVVTAAGDCFSADDVVLAGGVWGPDLTALTGLDLPLFPVAHPYVYDGPAAAWSTGPFVRWPEHHVYSRIHGDRLGIGTYDHHPVPVNQDGLAAGAGLEWSAEFDPAVEAAQGLLRPEARFTPERRINGVFAMTPDNLPFLGRHPSMEGVWIAQALWVTHAAGASRMLTEAMLDGLEIVQELDPARFAGTDAAMLKDSALRLYRDIYANDAT
ncbi:FAD-binding oxidoreductase [Zhihengliuella sp.]|uniref:NAD(P)/FAD-dependent oxidoreductase n=1 Tax=Zhihengliuella sp. TaxID=1954483 RepID=UPI0028110F86|nr:FAD-binding oxidoreductase [Zhihengliuella sp.]